MKGMVIVRKLQKLMKMPETTLQMDCQGVSHVRRCTHRHLSLKAAAQGLFDLAKIPSGPLFSAASVRTNNPAQRKRHSASRSHMRGRVARGPQCACSIMRARNE